MLPYYFENAQEKPQIAALLPEFRRCHNYADRLAFWDRHWNELKLSECDESCVQYGCSCEFSLCYSSIEFDDDKDEGKASIAFGMKLWITCKSWEDVQQWPILTLTPFTREEARLFADWAVLRRAKMTAAPIASEKLIDSFELHYYKIASNLDREHYLKLSREEALAWKNDEIKDMTRLRSIESLLEIDLNLYSTFAQQLRFNSGVDIGAYIPLGNANMKWEVIDTYLFTKCKYEYGLHMEYFEPTQVLYAVKNQPSQIKAIQIEANKDQEGIIKERDNIIEEVLAPLGGLNHRGDQIINEVTFIELIEYTKMLVHHNRLPDITRKIQQTGATNEEIIYTYYRLYQKLKKAKLERRIYIDFIYNVFGQLGGLTTETIYKKFSKRPKSYDSDFSNYL